MIRHVLFTGEIGVGKSTVLRRMLALLGADARGIETYSTESRDAQCRRLFLRAYGSGEKGTLIGIVPGSDRTAAAPLFDTLAVRLLEDAQEKSKLIVIDEIGRLERDAHAYHAALKACFDSGKTVIGVLRKHKSEWADFIRSREDVLLLEVTQQNRDDLPALAADRIRRQIED